MRAFSGARLYLDGTVPTLAQAAAWTGSNVAYVQAAIVLLQDETALHSEQLRESVLAGCVPLLAAAREKRRKAEHVAVEEMVASWQCWTPGQRANFGRAVGVVEIWDDAIAPVINEEHGELAHAIAAE